jgi:hypothetical protein
VKTTTPPLLLGTAAVTGGLHGAFASRACEKRSWNSPGRVSALVSFCFGFACVDEAEEQGKEGTAQWACLWRNLLTLPFSLAFYLFFSSFILVLLTTTTALLLLFIQKILVYMWLSI